jgi:uncharacterized protein YycO
VRVTRHFPGQRADDLEPGDFILVHGFSIGPRLVGFGQKLHHEPRYAYWTHAALYVGNGLLIEAKGRHPVQHVQLAQYEARDVVAVRFGPAATNDMRFNAVRYACAQVGRGYGYLTILTLVCWSLFGGRLTIGLSGENVCSGLVANALTRLGEIFDGDTVTQMPADLAQKYDV